MTGVGRIPKVPFVAGENQYTLDLLPSPFITPAGPATSPTLPRFPVTMLHRFFDRLRQPFLFFITDLMSYCSAPSHLFTGNLREELLRTLVLYLSSICSFLRYSPSMVTCSMTYNTCAAASVVLLIRMIS